MLEQNGNEFVIKGRLINKQKKREFNNEQRDGVLFKSDLLDKDGSKIELVFFDDECQKYYEILEE